MSRIDETRLFIPVGIAVLTVSDTRTPENDKSGDTLVARIADAGHRLRARAIVPDDKERIASQVRATSGFAPSRSRTMPAERSPAS